jgi:hypothetical protein
VRTALTILIIVAVVLVALGAVNHTVTLDLDFLALDWTGVSLFWLSVVLAAVVVAAGVAAAWAARAAAVGAQRRLEKELGKTYKRLREAQAAGAQTAVAEIGATEATALAPAPPEQAPPGAAGSPPEVGPADLTAVTMAVAVPSAAGWDEAAGAVPGDATSAGDERPDVAVELPAPAEPDKAVAGSAADDGARDGDDAFPGADDAGAERALTTVSPPDPAGVGGHGDDVTAVTMAASAVGGGEHDGEGSAEHDESAGAGEDDPPASDDPPAAS